MNRMVVSAAAGLAGGALGLVAMRFAMQGTKKALEKLDSSGEDGEDGDGREDGEEYISLTGFHAREGESATGALARVVYERATGHALDEEREETAGEWVHRGYGEAVGLTYAMLATGRGWGVKGGTLYGVLLWLLGDEVMVPLLGLSKKPTSYGLDGHLPALVGHLAYGAALGAVVDASEAWMQSREDADAGLASRSARFDG